MNVNPDSRRVFPVDANHPGVRLTIILACVAGFVFAFSVVIPFLSRTLGLTGLIEVVVFVAGVVTFTGVIGYTSELAVKRVWPSGRSLDVDSAGLSLRDRKGVTTIDWSSATKIHRWYFKISSNRTWVPKGWYCVAAHAANGESSISFYAFIARTDASKLPDWEKFAQLSGSRVATTSDSGTEASAALRVAEMHRWEFGAEVDHKYIGEVLRLIHQYEHVHDTSQSLGRTQGVSS